MARKGHSEEQIIYAGPAAVLSVFFFTHKPERQLKNEPQRDVLGGDDWFQRFLTLARPEAPSPKSQNVGYDPIMQAVEPIRIVDYREDWPAAFAALRDRISLCVGTLASAIEHVGSTSVPGLSSKDKIDIDIVSNQLPAVTDRLAGIGYVHRGNLGIEGREVFDPPAGDHPHNLYLCTPGAVSLRNHLTVREHLRAHPADATAYADLKRRLAEEFPFDRSAYVAGKTGFILGILARYGFSGEQLDSIRGANVRRFCRGL